MTSGWPNGRGACHAGCILPSPSLMCPPPAATLFGQSGRAQALVESWMDTGIGITAPISVQRLRCSAPTGVWQTCLSSFRWIGSLPGAAGKNSSVSCKSGASSKVPGPRSGPAVLEGVHRHSQSWGREERENPSAKPQLQSLRGEICQNHQVRVLESICDFRRATSAPPYQGIRRALHDRAVSPRHRWPTHQERRSDE